MTEPKTTGSGWGQFVSGEPIASPTQLNVGDLLTDYCRQFNARNLVRVTEVWSDRFHGRFVDPQDPSRPRIWDDGEFNVWDFEMGGEGTILERDFHRAIPHEAAATLS